MSSLVHPSTHLDTPDASIAPNAFVGGIGFDWLMSVVGMIFLGGLFLDGWAHNHGKVDQTFFTPWHAFFYGGFFLITLILVSTLGVNRHRGAAWNHVLPVGYSLSMLGVLIFAAGGVGDLLWHETFGVEAEFDALFSPSHLVLAIGMNLILTGPLRAAWARLHRQLTWRKAGPMLLSLTALISSLTFMLMAAHPLVNSVAGATHDYRDRIGQIAGVTSILLTTVLLMGPTLLAIRRWRLPAGSLLLVWGINTLAMFTVNWHHDYTLWQTLAMLIAVVGVEIIRLRLEPLVEKPNNLRIFAALAPFLLMTSYFIALHLTEGTRWSVHLWTGVLVEVAIAGWLLSYLVVPPAMPDRE